MPWLTLLSWLEDRLRVWDVLAGEELLAPQLHPTAVQLGGQTRTADELITQGALTFV